MEVLLYTLNAFAKNADWWNPAGVILDAEDLKNEEMQKIAKKAWLSETAFISRSDCADFKVQFFTPNSEVDLCGHATIGSFYLMKHLNIIWAWIHTQETKAGILSVEIREDSWVFMTQNKPIFYETIKVSNILGSLSSNNTDIIDHNFPIQIVSTWLKDIIIPVKSLDDLFWIKPNFNLISDICRKYNAVGYHLFTLETMSESTAHCRNFTPLYDIDEESATWTSNWALACYLLKYCNVSRNWLNRFIFEQGYSIERPSEVLVDIVNDSWVASDLRVWGIARNIQKTAIAL